MKRKVLNSDLEACLAQGMGIVETARKLNVNKSTISKRAKRLSISLNKNKQKITRDLVLFHGGEVVGKEINAIDQLAKINRHANSILDGLMAVINGDGDAVERLQAQADIKGKDPRELALKVMAEIRQQISAQFAMLRDLYNINFAKFQEEVVTCIGEASEDVRQKIIDNLRAKPIIPTAIGQD